MCLGIPGRIIEISDEHLHIAKADVGGVKRKINIGLLTDEGVEPGDWVLIHVGFAMSKIDEEEASATLDFLEELGSAYDDEIDAFKSSSIE